MKYDEASLLTRNKHFFRFFMPYVFQRLEGCGTNVFLPLNRDYKPLGQTTREHVDYDDFVTGAAKFARDPMTLKELWTRADPELGLMWLYDDDPASRVDYFRRLEALMTKSITPAILKD